MEELVRAVLTGNAAVVALCGTRIDFGGSPPGTADPRVVLWTVSDSEGHNLTGPDGMSQGRVQIDCYAENYASAKVLARAVRAALDGHRGAALQGVFLVGTRDQREGGSNEAYRPWRVSMDFLTAYNPA